MSLLSDINISQDNAATRFGYFGKKLQLALYCKFTAEIVGHRILKIGRLIFRSNNNTSILFWLFVYNAFITTNTFNICVDQTSDLSVQQQPEWRAQSPAKVWTHFHFVNKVIVDVTFRPRSGAVSWWVVLNRLHPSFATVIPGHCNLRHCNSNMTSSTKPEIHNASWPRQRRIEPRPQVTCKQN